MWVSEWVGGVGVWVGCIWMAELFCNFCLFALMGKWRIRIVAEQGSKVNFFCADKVSSLNKLFSPSIGFNWVFFGYFGGRQKRPIRLITWVHDVRCDRLTGDRRGREGLIERRKKKFVKRKMLFFYWNWKEKKKEKQPWEWNQRVIGEKVPDKDNNNEQRDIIVSMNHLGGVF